MNALESLAAAVSHAVPAAWTRLRAPRDPNGVWWLDAKVDDHHVTVEWSPRRGFGVSASVFEDGYGEGPEETFTQESAATGRVIGLLQKRAFTSPPAPVALRELRALLGRTQVEVAQRMGVGQAAVSRLEHREDVTVGSLKRYVEAVGGMLEIRVRTPAGDEVPILLAGSGGVGKSTTASLICRHLEAALETHRQAADAEVPAAEDLATLCSSVRASLPSSWSIPHIDLRTDALPAETTARCWPRDSSIFVSADRLGRLAALLASPVTAPEWPLAAVRRDLTRHLVAHEIGHTVSPRDVVESLPGWVADDDELRADAVAGWFGARTGIDARSGARLAHLLGCSVRGCTHPAPGDRVAAYLLGHLAGGAPTPRMGELSLLVLRVRDLERARAFYDLLGLKLGQEKHGRGPVHYAASLPGGMVFEIYPCAEGRHVGGVRVGLRVEDPASSVSRLRSAGLLSAPPRSPPEDPATQVFDDPDGNTVELTALAAK